MINWMHARIRKFAADPYHLIAVLFGGFCAVILTMAFAPLIIQYSVAIVLSVVVFVVLQLHLNEAHKDRVRQQIEWDAASAILVDSHRRLAELSDPVQRAT